MTNSEFIRWIDGFMALTTEEKVSSAQWKIILNHADLVQAIDGQLNQSILQFISQVNDRFVRETQIAFTEFKKIYLCTQ